MTDNRLKMIKGRNKPSVIGHRSSVIYRAILLGSPIRHTLSPRIFACFSEMTDIPFEYYACETFPQNFSAYFEAIKKSGAIGANITIPYKEKVLQHIARLSPDARAIGAVNTIKFTKKGAVGHNTDWTGFLAPLKRRKIVLKNKNAIVLGAGGAARAVIYALLREGVQKIFLFNRALRRAKKISKHFGLVRNDGKKIIPFALADKISLKEKLSKKPCLIVNTIPHSPNCRGVQLNAPTCLSFSPRTLAYDLVYRPTETPFIRLAKKSGAKTISGAEMLAAHAAFAWRVWTGRKIPEEVERRAFNIIKRKV